MRHHIDGDIELYDLETDIGEQQNVAHDHSTVITRISEIMRSARTESDLFPLDRERSP